VRSGRPKKVTEELEQAIIAAVTLDQYGREMSLSEFGVNFIFLEGHGKSITSTWIS